MANINDFRRRRLAAAAGRPERESWWRGYARRRYWVYVLNKWTWRVITAAILLYLAVNLIAGNGIFRNNETPSPWRDAAMQKAIDNRDFTFPHIRESAESTAVVEFSDEE